MKKFFNTTSDTNDEKLILTWKLENWDNIAKAFGPICFADRNYPDSKGQIDFAHHRGGRLYLDLDHPVIITYDTYFQTMDIKFNFLRKKLDLIEFKWILGL